MLKVRSPAGVELPLLKRGATLVGMPEPFNAGNALKLAAAGITAFAPEAAPRTTRAQSLNVPHETDDMDKTMMVFGDAKKVTEDMVKAVERICRKSGHSP